MKSAAAAVNSPSLGASVVDGGVRFAVRSQTAERVWVSIFDRKGERETDRVELQRAEDAVFAATVPDLKAGTRYGLRADGRYEPSAGHWFDPQKLLVDPYATGIDRAFVYDARLALSRAEAVDTASLVPKSVVVKPAKAVRRRPPLFRAGGLVYELSVRGFTMRHPGVPKEKRGTVAALAEPVVIEHMQKLGVDAVELMPIAAWIDERHLPPLGLSNAWGYNPVAFMALDPRLVPGGMRELRDTVATLHDAGIGVIFDVVFNHTGESDALGPTLSLRGLDNLAYYRHAMGEPRRLVNDTGCGNTLDCASPLVHALVVDSLRHFVSQAGVDGFRFDLAPILGRDERGFDANAPLLEAIRTDPLLADRVMLAEPWDIGPDGYQLGRFRPPFLEWNDRYRDDVRRFWRGDRGTVGALATRLAGSSDVFSEHAATRSLNFIAAHDGMTLADVTAYERRHNEANGEENRDGHHENFSWNNGVEGEADEVALYEKRRRDVMAMLATLFASRGTIMLTAGDEFGRSQGGNNNAYAQDNATTWLDWLGRDRMLEDWCAELSALRRRSVALSSIGFLSGVPQPDKGVPDVEWLAESGRPLTVAGWEDPARQRLTMVLSDDVAESGHARIAVLFNGDRRATVFNLPARDGHAWAPLLSPDGGLRLLEEGGYLVEGRAVVFAVETVTG